MYGTFNNFLLFCVSYGFVNSLTFEFIKCTSVLQSDNHIIGAQNCCCFLVLIISMIPESNNDSKPGAS